MSNNRLDTAWNEADVQQEVQDKGSVLGASHFVTFPHSNLSFEKTTKIAAAARY